MADFSMILAAAVHDMKNSLSLMMGSIEEIAEELEHATDEQKRKINSLHYEANRLNTSMVHILSLYRAQELTLPINLDEHYLIDLFNDIQTANAPYLRMRGITLEIDVPSDLSAYLDYDLTFVLLNDMVINAMRYCRSRIRLHGSIDGQYTLIQVDDDGPGYPQAMLDSAEMDMQQVELSSGRTGLGIYFARMIAEAHEIHGHNGKIALQNAGDFNGSQFSLWLPR
ncbi:sensor histidine kinase KdpD [Bowmanella sp. JS7-9]|uniref:histidine kinase n=1 Tax=Pseudobowmanella zhangzhouensis TaxID=1537679 RepID=A0ABW1XL18_9ALTE|nr:HAMP domain-containing sensor histidine kinase [Bowmanella sp. JS7-9]TBX27445.1 hypothetical protein TK45_01510 [Bowmanella sp. JS7-9]